SSSVRDSFARLRCERTGPRFRLDRHAALQGWRITADTSMIPDSLRIIHRPEKIGARLIPGHRDGDLITGAFNRPAVGTVVGRKTRLSYPEIGSWVKREPLPATRFMAGSGGGWIAASLVLRDRVRV
ncbi:MAG: hypothetical protein ACK5PF_00530, partial [bacterium]